jgi:hypothetical protein
MYEEAKKAIRYILKRYYKYKKLWDNIRHITRVYGREQASRA